MKLLAAIEPDWTRLAVPLLGLAGFAVVASLGKRRPPALALVVLSALLGSWSFGVGLVWSKRWESMIRGWAETSTGWSSNPDAWQWTGLLVLAYAAVLAAALSLRAFSEGRQNRGWAFALAGLGAFAIWSTVVNYSAALAGVTGCIALGVLVASSMPGTVAPADRLSGGRGAGRALVIVAATAFGLLLLGLWVVSRIASG